jgi:hypothetical protein
MDRVEPGEPEERVMNELDRKIREALPADEAELLGPLDEPSLWQQVLEMFQGRLRWVSVLVAVGGVAFAVFMVVSAVCFFRAESMREMIAWAGGFGLSLIAVSVSRLWFWLLLHRNAVLREVKRVELQLARLSSRLKIPT